jgi:hypothetical protein
MRGFAQKIRSAPFMKKPFVDSFGFLYIEAAGTDNFVKALKNLRAGW